ncbi:carboxymuconolactone decarboxylase family protein [Micrococcus endophyticus]|uniref:AhpD family alkylhydroperoxidase n=1 Tax=Micrococcus endophyticus TaxID=455343 RepID=A0A4Y8ZH99_9MICC|nr:carboxymuconolactone decarboxylase family protein [Micrococcus endophyticus]MBB5848963.1 AhpD family alkylhydroperoxidase [Micrococcus endophyticus]TFI49819.1 carboxymuconolactone decarboxylase family protein [Micrococcus endophyticus]
MSAAENPAPRKDPLAFYLDKAVPDAWKAVGGLASAVRTAAEEAGLDRQLVELVNLRVSQINGCGFCLDLHAREGAKAGLSAQRMALLPAWREAEAVYSEQERAALDLAEAVTELPEQEQLHYVQASTAAALTDAQYAAVQWAAMAMNLTNRISILSHHPVRRRED